MSATPVHSTGAIARRCGGEAARRLAKSCIASQMISPAPTSCATVAKTWALSGASASAHAFLGAFSPPVVSPPSRKNGIWTAKAVR
jgi:hypothetical protein